MKCKLRVFSSLVTSIASGTMAVSAIAQPAAPGGVSPEGGPPQPPPEAITACADKHVGDFCQITTPQGAMSGACQAMQEQLVCVPEGGPPGGGPPAEPR